MALAGPVGNTDMNVAFRLQSKAQVFSAASNVLMNARVDLCAAASSVGLVFVGSINPELIVLCLKDLEASRGDQSPPVRRVPMPGPITQLATNCDGTILAVDVNVNGTPQIQLYSIPSFLTPNVQKVREFRVSADNSSSVQLCWNPVISSTLAVCTSSGQLNLYALKDSGIDFHSIDPSLQAKCCCWSPKGKQIVAGFANGKLIQFNMELKSARVIECPPGVFSSGGSFETIAVQWLSTYQFALALSSQQEMRPVIYILNAPKAGALQYIAYSEVCFSTSEVRPSRIYLQYIQQWGMILIASANCIDVSYLKISKPGDVPEWTQDFPSDQYPCELPLTPDRDESFPLGFSLDTACQGKILQEDSTPYPQMPMIHMLSTNGVLCSYYVLNTTASYVDICSPPRPIDPRVVQQFFKASTPSAPQNVTPNPPKDENVLKTPVQSQPVPFAHSTPATVKTNLFGSVSQPPPQASNAFSGFSMLSGSTTQTPPSTVTPPQPSTFQFATKPSTPVTSQEQPQNKPLITIPPTYNPQPSQNKPESVDRSSEKSSADEIEDEKVYMKMIQDEMKAFELEFNFLMDKSKSMKVRIGTKEESAEMRKNLEELDELKKEAIETIESLRSDVQTNRLGITEMFAMIYEAKSKCERDNKKMMLNKGLDRSSKRKIENLNKMVQQVDIQVNAACQLLQSQWANYQESVNKNKKNLMHIPSMEGIYQTLTKQQDIIYRLSGKLKLIKSRLGICDDVKKQKNANVNKTIESLSESIISMSLADQVEAERPKLSDKKIKNLINSLTGREPLEIKPQRPQLPGLDSEIIMQKKKAALKSLQRKVEKPKVETTAKSETVTIKPVIPQQQQPQPFVSKPPLESTFNLTQKPIFAAPAQVSQPIQLTTKKPEEPKPFSFASQPTMPSVPSFNMPAATSQPSFGFSSTPLILNAEKDKKKEEPVKLTPQPQKVDQKPPATIASAPIAVSAAFSLPLATNKTPPKESEKSKAPEPLTTNETTSFTFSLPGKKETPVKPLFGTTPSSNVSDSVKTAFSFGSSGGDGSFTSQPSSGFSFASLEKAPTEKSTASSMPASSTPSIFGSAPATTTSASIFSGSGFSLSFGDANKTPSTTPAVTQSLSFGAKPAENKNIFSSPPSLFGSNASATSASTGTTSTVTISVSESKPATSFSFANFGSSITPTSTQSSLVSSSSADSQTPPVSQTKSETNVPQAKPADSVKSLLTGVGICSPDVPKADSSTPKPNIFGSVSSTPQTSTPTASIFGQSSSIFGQAKSPTTPPVSTIVSSQNQVTTTASPSIFGSAITTQSSSGSLFGSLSLGGTSSDQPSTNIFSAKPDQSVFGTPSSTSIFGSSSGNIFGSPTPAQQPASPPTNIFGSVPAATTQSTSIFGQSSSIFNQAKTPPTTTSASIFGQSSSTFSSSPFGQPASPQAGGSIFGGTSSFASPPAGGNIFSGGANAAPTFGGAPSFGSTGGNIFSGASSNQPAFGSSATFSNTFGSGTSIFGQQAQQQPTFGASATFGSPKANIFASASPQAPSTGNIFEQLGQQQSGNLFGNLAGQTQQPPPQQQQGGVFSGSAFSSWR